jgi:Ser/Thr protein kinase RdoA (MazF antagonist)
MILIPRPGYVRRLFAARTGARKVAVRAEEIEAVLAYYDLGHWQVDDALAGGNSNNVSLQTSRGKKALKRYFWSLPSTMQEHSILRHLAGTDFPSPRLVVNKDGLTCTELEDKHYAIYDFVVGYCCANYFMPPKTRQRLIAQAAETLAHLHQLMVGFVPEGRKFNGFMPNGERLWRDVAWHLNVLEQYVETIAKKKSLDDLDTFLSGIAEGIRRDLIEVGRHYEQADPQLPKLVIHGDYAPQNILFNRQGVVAVLDFGDACVNLRALDVARGLTSFSSMGKCGVDERLARVFLRSYQAQQPLTEREIEAIPDLIRWRHLRNIIWKLANMESHPSQKTRDAHLRTFRHKWERNRWMKAHSDELRASFIKARE